MLKQIAVSVLLALLPIAFLNAQEDSVAVLAKILADKGTISVSELGRVQSAEQAQKLAILAGILQSKGLLNSGDLAKLSMAAQPAAQQDGVAASAQPNRPAPPTADLPVTTKKHVPVSLYGTMLFTSGFNTAGYNFEDVPTIASKQGSDPTGGDKNFYETARQSRFGLRLDPTEIGGGKLTGAFEFDMMGGQAPYVNGIGMNLFRMRLAYGRLDWNNVSIEAGQDWSIFSPLNPTSMNMYGIPEFTASGNAWIRLPQLRLELRNAVAARQHLLWQFAASDPNMGDYSTTAFSAARQPGIGERGRMPSLESRLAWSASQDDRDYTIGVSAHYGRGKNAGAIGALNVQSPVDSWGVALDYSLPFTKYFNLTGEAYEGRALGIYSVASGEAIGAVGTPGAHGVLSRGGWMQAQFNFDKQWQTNLAYGIDDPSASELPIGNRSRNQTYMGNLIFKATSNVNLSLEYRRLLTDYRNQYFANERGDHVDLGFAYIF